MHLYRLCRQSMNYKTAKFQKCVCSYHKNPGSEPDMISGDKRTRTRPGESKEKVRHPRGILCMSLRPSSFDPSDLPSVYTETQRKGCRRLGAQTYRTSGRNTRMGRTPIRTFTETVMTLPEHVIRVAKIYNSTVSNGHIVSTGHEETEVVKFKAPLPNADAMAWNPFSLTSERNKSCWFAKRALFALISRMTPWL